MAQHRIAVGRIRIAARMAVLAPTLVGSAQRPDVIGVDDGGDAEPVGVRDQPVCRRPPEASLLWVVVRLEGDVHVTPVVVRRPPDVPAVDTLWAVPPCHVL